MKAPHAPNLDERRGEKFAAELRDRAQAWIPAWGLVDSEGDFGAALLQVAARFSSEVAERLDCAGDKMRRGFLDWLGVPRKAARPARVPVVLKLADTAQEAVLAEAPVQMQADAGGTSVVFETEKDVRVVPGRLEIVVGVDADQDAYYLPPPGLSDLQPAEPLPTQWRLKSFAAAGATKLQLDPELGLAAGMILGANGKQYKVVKPDKDLVTIEPPLETELAESTPVSKVTTFSPFGGEARNWQEHGLYLGDKELLKIEAAATIEVVGAIELREGYTWEYSGQRNPNDEVGWLPLTPDDNRQKTVNDAIVLAKPKGAIELMKVNGQNSRWIRATKKRIDSPNEVFAVEALKLRINCSNNPPCPPPDSAAPGPTPEAMANSTPLVLSGPFYPLGREPRQFDAFYLGCSEAFSKKGAAAQVCFEMSDATCLAYTPVRAGLFANKGALAGVGKDRALHLFQLTSANGAMSAFRDPLRPPLPAEPGLDVKETTPVDLSPRCRPVIWNAPSSGDDFFVAVAAGGDIWIWHENAGEPNKSGWSRHSRVPDLAGRPAEIENIIVLKDHPDRPGAVLSSGRFLVFDGTTWIQPRKPPTTGPLLRDYAALAPIYDGNLGLTKSMVAVGVDEKLYRLETDGTEVDLSLMNGPGVDPLLTNLDVGDVPAGGSVPVGGIRPAAIDDGKLSVVAVRGTRGELVAVKDGSPDQLVSLGANVKAIGAEVSISQVGGRRQFSVGARMAADSVLVASWVPTFTAGNPPPVFQSLIPDAASEVGGTPLTLGAYMVVPGGRGDAFVAPFNPSGQLEFTKIIGEGVIIPAPALFAIGDFLSALTKSTGVRKEWQLTKPPRTRGTTDVLYMVEPAFGEAVADNPQLIGYSASENRAGKVKGATKFHSNVPLDPAIESGTILRVQVAGQPVAFCEVATANPVTGNVTVKAGTPLPGVNGNTLSYRTPHPCPATVVPAIEFDPSGDGNWDAALLDTAKLHVDAPFQPSSQQATAFGVVGTHPTVVALAQHWTLPPPLTTPTHFIIDGVIGVWGHQLADSSSNPALSWEYWNGKGWWSLEITDEGTNRFANTGAVQFKVPQDIAESDWAGKTNFWIRARLVGGDYGKEEVKVISKPGANPGETEQVVVRSTENIKAPHVLDLDISYSICDELFPMFVLAQDSGSYRDQSDANQNAGAIVEAFVPLAETLRRLSNVAASLQTSTVSPPECNGQPRQPAPAQTLTGTASLQASDDCPLECNDQIRQPTPTQTLTGAAPAPAPHGGRALLIGLDATPSEAPVNILLLVDQENKHDAFAPMTFEALVADHFVPIVADDTTRALGESGLLSIAFADPPTRSELFGQKNLTWLWLTPKSNTNGAWLPALRGAYLNAAWASATETLTRELLGSSDGAPNMSVRLARPPVLDHTLKLRVKEPLGDEERAALLKADAAKVVREREALTGDWIDWVLWKQVVDPNDEPADARVYALDESTGEIRFGDGQHGFIPPIGRDSIVAFSYQRTELGPSGGATVPGNLIKARTELNLVSPIATVESVIAADQSAGGAPPENDDRVLRFGHARLRHRNRAITLHDLEDLTLESSPDIAQALALAQRSHVRLVIIMRGKNPTPSAPQRRELYRYLLDTAPTSLCAPSALRIEGPKIRRLRIELELLVETLDHAGELAAHVKQRLAGFFDTATGGIDGLGWPIGANPSEDDIAFALLDSPYLDSIKRVTLREIADDGSEQPWPDTLKQNELAMLATDPIRIQFETAEVVI